MDVADTEEERDVSCDMVEEVPTTDVPKSPLLVDVEDSSLDVVTLIAGSGDTALEVADAVACEEDDLEVSQLMFVVCDSVEVCWDDCEDDDSGKSHGLTPRWPMTSGKE